MYFHIIIHHTIETCPWPFLKLCQIVIVPQLSHRILTQKPKAMGHNYHVNILYNIYFLLIELFLIITNIHNTA